MDDWGKGGRSDVMLVAELRFRYETTRVLAFPGATVDVHESLSVPRPYKGSCLHALGISRDGHDLAEQHVEVE